MAGREKYYLDVARELDPPIAPTMPTLIPNDANICNRAEKFLTSVLI
jgi:hypothetical protein